jgi:drug/metabolite transporter (DMT)-like permease
VKAHSVAVKPGLSDTAVANLMLVSLSLGWGITWPIMKIALLEIPPISMRMGTTAIGAAALFAIAALSNRGLTIPRGKARVHVAIAGILNIVGFSLFTAFAQLTAATTRVTILTYTMPIWAALLARFVLGERFTVNRSISLFLCVSGLAVLVYPLTEHGIPGGILLAIGAGVSWAGGTIYQKWARMNGDPVIVAAWQVAVGFIVMGACVLIFEGRPHLWPASGAAIFGVVFTGVVGSGVAYVIWFEVVRRLPAMTASLGVLSVPVIGVLASVLILGERPTIADMIGFLLIFAASVCVLIQPRGLVRAA